MTRRKKALAALMVLLLTAAAGLYAFGFFDPRPDPAFEDKIAASAKPAIEPLIAGEAERLDVSALSVFIQTGEDPGEALHFGRSRPEGLFQAASLSKAVAAATILTLAQREGVGLDEDIRPQITSLDIAALEGGDRPITLRQLLSHTTGASQSGYLGYPREEKLPSTADIIADPPRFFEFALAFNGEPGVMRYSGGGYTIAQLWAEDVAGADFAEIAQSLVLGPVGMTHSTFVQPIDEKGEPPGAIIGADTKFGLQRALFPTLDNGWHNYPEQAAAGMWTTPQDYARFAASVLDAAQGADTAIAQPVAKAMVSAQVETGWESGPQSYGLGLMLDIADDGALIQVSHSGGNIGYRCYFIARPARDGLPRKIVVVMGNTGSAAPLTRALASGLMRRRD
ncbi:MAG: serine hydrolase domain-containing protein [Pseudomonadota bacterium]